MNKKFEWAQLPTLQSKEILSELMEAREEPLAKMIIAETGLGKTNAITLFKQKNPHNTFVVTLGESYTRNDMLDEIATLTGAFRYAGKNSKHQRVLSVSKKFNELADDNCVLILDEFENATIPVLKSIKELYDAIGKNCSIVLIGTSQLITQFNKKSISQSIPQLRRRFKAGSRFITPIKKARDFKPFFDKYIPNELAVQDLLLTLSDNYGELHDYLYPVLNNCSKKSIKISAEVFKNYHKIKM
jgi:DNA transposition AAA+ family ATPase